MRFRCFLEASVLTIFLARKAGLIKEKSKNDNTSETVNSIFSGHTNSLVARFALIATLIVILMIPLSMVSSTVSERSLLYNSVQQDIAYNWGSRQSLDGVALLVPYTEKFDSVETVTDSEGKKSKRNKTTYKQRTAIALPEELNIDLALVSEIPRYIGTIGKYRPYSLAKSMASSWHFRY